MGLSYKYSIFLLFAPGVVCSRKIIIFVDMKATKLITATLALCLALGARAQQAVEWTAYDFPTDNTIYGSPKLIQTALGAAVEFNGQTDGAFLNALPVAGMDELTIEMVFKPYSSQRFEQRFLHIGTIRGPRILFESRVLPEGKWYFDAYVNLGAPRQKALIDPKLTHPTDRWYNLAFTLSKDGIRSYVDGVEECSDPLSFEALIKEGLTSVGVRQNMVCWFEGAIYKIRITPKCLEPKQMLQDHILLNGPYPYQDPSLSVEQRVDDLMGRLSLEQKASLMMNSSRAIPELGINAYDWWSEALHGAARAGIATVFPQAIAMAASWDDALLKEVFDITSTEQRIKYLQYRREGGNPRYHGLTVWTPNINIFRDPRWGRGQETYGEDPYLTTRMGYAAVTGLQGESAGGYDKLHACLKHYAVHSGPEPNRHRFDVSNLPHQDLMETYLYAFEKLVKSTDVQEVMCAYNRLDGKPCCGNDQLLSYYLREQWGYKGLVVSDCGAIDDFHKPGRHETFLNEPTSAVANAVRTGTDIECGSSYRNLVQSVREGKISEAELDVSVRRLLRARFRLGEMDYGKGVVAWDEIDEKLLASAGHRAVSLRMARETMTLLQNRNAALPLAAGQKYFVTGPNAANSKAPLGNYEGTPHHVISALEGIEARVGKESLVDSAAESDVIIYIGGISPQLEGEEMRVKVEGFEGGDRTTIELPKDQRSEIAQLAALGKKLIFVNYSGSAVALVPESKACDAILQAWYGGEFAGQAIAEVLFGDVNPSGKLPVTFYRSDKDLPDFEDYTMKGRTYRYFKGKALWPFGHGLSYSTFEYGQARIEDGKLIIPITNTSKISGTEVAQAYLAGGKGQPQLSLRGFTRVFVPAGQTVEAVIALEDGFFEQYNSHSGTMQPVKGRNTVLYGPSSDIKTLKSIKITR